MRLFFATLAFSVACSQAFAAPVIHDCRIHKNSGFFTDEMLFSLDDMTGEVMVVDPMIMYYNNERAIAAQLTQNSPKKTTFRWTMSMTNSSGQTSMMKFRAVLQRPSMRFLISARPAGYRSAFTGRGSCAIIKADLPGF